MLLNRYKLWLIALAATLFVGSVAHAQKFGPFIEPDTFNPDLQFFAPVEIDDYGGREKPNSGFFLNYDRLYIAFSRPGGAASFNSGDQSDFTWGNRFDGGFMNDEGKGWLVSVIDVSGPNAVFISSFQPKIATVTTNQGGGGTGTTTTQTLPLRDTQTAVTQNLNVGCLSSIEMDRVWRQTEFHNGGIFEPLVGLRYINFRDFGRRESYQRFAADAAGDPDFGAPNFIGPYERLLSDQSSVENRMFGGQLGFRLTKTHGHWKLGSELRMFGLNNWQNYTAYSDTVLRNANPTDAGGGNNNTGSGTVQINNFRTLPTNNSANEFVFGGEVRANASYQLTRDIAFNFGFSYINLGHGIGRGLDFRHNTGDLTIMGTNFGLVYNR